MLALTQWIPPQIDYFSCNVDASFDKIRQAAGLGVIISENAGKIIQVQEEKVVVKSVGIA